MGYLLGSIHLDKSLSVNWKHQPPLGVRLSIYKSTASLKLDFSKP